MNEMATKIQEVLLQLRKDVLACSVDSSLVSSLEEKYGMLFLKSEGSKMLNIVYSGELAHVLNHKFEVDISLEKLNELLPEICPSMGMTLEPMALVSDLSNPVPAMYIINLTGK